MSWLQWYDWNCLKTALNPNQSISAESFHILNYCICFQYLIKKNKNSVVVFLMYKKKWVCMWKRVKLSDLFQSKECWLMSHLPPMVYPRNYILHGGSWYWECLHIEIRLKYYASLPQHLVQTVLSAENLA